MLNQVQSPNYSSILASFAILCSVQRFRKRSEKFFELHNVNRLCDDSPDQSVTNIFEYLNIFVTNIYLDIRSYHFFDTNIF